MTSGRKGRVEEECMLEGKGRREEGEKAGRTGEEKEDKRKR